MSHNNKNQKNKILKPCTFPVENFACNGIKTSETIPVPTHYDMKLYREGSLHFSAT